LDRTVPLAQSRSEAIQVFAAHLFFGNCVLWHRAGVKKVAKPTIAKKKPPAPKKYGRRADLGAPIEGFFAKQQPHLRPILEELRKLVEAAAPDATSAIKWGMPFYTVGGQMMCALAGFKGTST
jgi:hypothetical protein